MVTEKDFTAARARPLEPKECSFPHQPALLAPPWHLGKLRILPSGRFLSDRAWRGLEQTEGSAKSQQVSLRTPRTGTRGAPPSAQSPSLPPFGLGLVSHGQLKGPLFQEAFPDPTGQDLQVPLYNMFLEHLYFTPSSHL